MKRETVLRMLNKRYHESIRSIKYSNVYQDMVNVNGGIYDEEKENQFEKNMKIDIEQLSFLIQCLKNKYKVEILLNN